MAETFYVNFVMGYSGNKQHSKIFYKFYSVTGDKVISFSHKDLRKFRFPGIGDENFDGEEQGEDFGELHGEDVGDSDSEIEVVLFFLCLNSLDFITLAFRLFNDITDCRLLMAWWSVPCFFKFLYPCVASNLFVLPCIDSVCSM